MIKIDDITNTTKQEFISLCLEFYNTNAVLHQIPTEYIENTANEAINKSPYLRCMLIYKDDAVVGYLLLSITYSNEVGGMVLLLEEIYIRPKFQGKGIGKEVFSFIFKSYKNKVKRYRLEVSRENIRAKDLYLKQGFMDLDYLQMIIEPKE